VLREPFLPKGHGKPRVDEWRIPGGKPMEIDRRTCRRGNRKKIEFRPLKASPRIAARQGRCARVFLSATARAAIVLFRP
jgi:hypothetical protein